MSFSLLNPFRRLVYVIIIYLSIKQRSTLFPTSFGPNRSPLPQARGTLIWAESENIDSENLYWNLFDIMQTHLFNFKLNVLVRMDRYLYHDDLLFCLSFLNTFLFLVIYIFPFYSSSNYELRSHCSHHQYFVLIQYAIFGIDIGNLSSISFAVLLPILQSS